MALSVKVNGDGSQCSLLTAGFSHSDICGTGLVAFWRLSEHFQYAVAMMIFHREALCEGPNHIMQDRSLIAVLMEYKIAEELYVKANQLNSTLRYITELVGIGKSSLHFRTTIYKPENRQVLGSLDLKGVLIENKSRRSMRIPEWLLDKYSDFNPGIHMLPYILEPSNTFNKIYRSSYCVKVSDIDIENHMNNNQYYRLCFDKANDAVANGNWFDNFKGEIYRYSVKSLKGVYAKECRLGDTLDVLIWEDVKLTNVLHFEISRANEICFQCTIVFYKSTHYPEAKL